MSQKKPNNHKEATTTICYSCKLPITQKHALKCVLCTKYYDFDCAGTSEKLYRLMDQNSKQKWKCQQCKTITKNPTNITLRKKPVRVQATKQIPSPRIQEQLPSRVASKASAESPVQNHTYDANDVTPYATPQADTYCDSHILTEEDYSDDDCSSLTNTMSKSADFTSNNARGDIESEDTIAQLSSELIATQNELENTILENNKLHRQINKMTKEIDLLKKLCYATPEGKKPKKRHSMCIASTSDYSSTLTPTRCFSETTDINSSLIINLQDKITKLQYDLNKSRQQIMDLEKQIDSMNALLKVNNLTQITAFNTNPKPHNNGISNLKTKHQRTILICGSQQCVGLASALIQTRRNNSDYIKKCGIHQYQINAETKPNALSQDVLESCKSVQLKPGDKLIIGTGENDTNPEIVISLLKDIIENYKDINIVILSVTNNNNLNVKQLNKRINSLCDKYRNSNFVTCNRYDKKTDMYASINCIIDFIDYNDKYLKPEQIKKMVLRDKSNVPLKKQYCKGTIPYYFARMLKNSSAIDDPLKHPNSEKIGTIPFYFPKANKNKTFFRA